MKWNEAKGEKIINEESQTKPNKDEHDNNIMQKNNRKLQF